MAVSSEGRDIQACVDQWCQHDTRYRGCTILIRDYRIYLEDVVIWRTDDSMVDVAQYGRRLPSFIALVTDIAAIELSGVDKDWLTIRMA